MWTSITTNVKVILVSFALIIIASAVSFTAGYAKRSVACTAEKKQAVDKAKAQATEAARTTENQLREDAAKEAKIYQQKLDDMKTEGQNEITKLKKKLAAMPVCTVPADVVGLLDPAYNFNLPNSAPAGFGTVGTATATDSTCAAELEIAARNYREVCVPNAIQLLGVQKAYETVRRLINGK